MSERVCREGQLPGRRKSDPLKAFSLYAPFLGLLHLGCQHPRGELGAASKPECSATSLLLL